MALTRVRAGAVHSVVTRVMTKEEVSTVVHDPRILQHEDQIEALSAKVPRRIATLPRPVTPAIVPTFGPLQGIRVVSTGIIVAQPYIGTKMAEFGAEVIHVERPGGDPFRVMAPLLTRGAREHS